MNGTRIQMPPESTNDIEREDSIDLAKDRLSWFKDKPFRLYQREAIEFILSSSRPVIAIEAPPGAGKSLTGMVAGQVMGDLIYLCHSKSLQAQLQAEFPEAETLMGRANYPCSRISLLTAAQCTHSKDAPCEYLSTCPYRVQKKRVLAHTLRILNYSYYLYECNLVGQFSEKRFVVCDEADMLEQALLKFISLTLGSRILQEYNIQSPEYLTAAEGRGVKNWIEWAKQTEGALLKKLMSVQSALNISEFHCGLEHKTTIHARREVEQLTSLVAQLNLFITYVDDTWLFERGKASRGEQWTFKPLWLTPELTRQFFLRHADQFVLMSAILPPKAVLSKILSIPAGDIDYFSSPSLFESERRRVFVRPLAKLTYKTMESGVPKIIRGVQRIMNQYPDQKGLIHTVSYHLRDKVMTALNDSRLITHNAKNRQEIVAEFQTSDRPLVLVSPSNERGISLAHDNCRFIIWVKAPYLNISDKVVSRRIYSSGIGNQWYQAMMVMTVVQGCGRGTRSADDWCDSYLLDDAIVEVIREKPGLWPVWWREALRWE